MGHKNQSRNNSRSGTCWSSTSPCPTSGSAWSPCRSPWRRSRSLLLSLSLSLKSLSQCHCHRHWPCHCYSIVIIIVISAKPDLVLTYLKICKYCNLCCYNHSRQNIVTFPIFLKRNIGILKCPWVMISKLFWIFF